MIGATHRESLSRTPTIHGVTDQHEHHASDQHGQNWRPNTDSTDDKHDTEKLKNQSEH
jgi:hypothetical protein